MRAWHHEDATPAGWWFVPPARERETGGLQSGLSS